VASRGLNERAVVGLAALLAFPVAVAAMVVAGAVAVASPVGAGAVAVALFAALVLLPWLVVRGAVAVVEHGQGR
jgi:hypothetical protein